MLFLELRLNKQMMITKIVSLLQRDYKASWICVKVFVMNSPRYSLTTIQHNSARRKENHETQKCKLERGE